MLEHDRPEDDTVPTGDIPRGGTWAAALAVSVGCIPLIAIAPQSWKVPLGIASMVFLAISVILLGISEVRDRRGRKSTPKRAWREAA
jgi:hypothetical protein